MKRVLWWCISHSDFTRQRSHVEYSAPIEDCPSLDFILASEVIELPTQRVKADNELEAEVAEAAMARGSDAEALVEAGGRGRRGRGRGNENQQPGPGTQQF